MGKIVAGFLIPHDPLMSSAPDAPPEHQKKACMDAFATVSRRLQEESVDTVIVIGDDHYTLHGPSCIPRCMIGIGDVEGPIEQWLGISREQIPNNPPLAEHIMQYGFDHDVDWVVSKSLMLDHSVTIPVAFAVRPAGNLKTIPVYINSGFAPFISNRRAYRIGQVIGEAVRSWKGSERVAILGTGGISHWVGMAEMGRVNVEWDQKIISFVERGNISSLLELTDEEILRDGGNGGLEIKNWMCAMGAMGPVRGEVITYEAVPEWISGCGYMEMKTA